MKKLSKIFAVVLVLAMALSILPMGAAAASNWTEVQLSNVGANDAIAIVVVKDGASYALLNNATKGPLASFDAASTEATSAMLWNVAAVTGGYNIKPYGDASKYLYMINDNNGVRVDDTAAVWSLSTYTIEGADYTYLTADDTSGNFRTLGVYFVSGAASNFRCYTLYNDVEPKTNHTKQNVKFYKWTGAMPGDNRQDLPTSASDIVDAIYALQSGENLSQYYKFESFTMTGTIVAATEVWNEQYSNGTVTIKVEGNDKEIIVFRYKAGTVDVGDIKTLAVGDKITLKVTSAKNYNGDYELDQPTLTAIEKAQTPSTSAPAGTTGATQGTAAPDKVGDNTGIVSMTAVMLLAVTALAALVIGNKKRNY